MELIKIVITGGPCGGKSSAAEAIRSVFAPKGYTVLFVSETATELIRGGVAPWTCGTTAEYQACLMKLQLKKEDVFEEAAATMGAEKVLLVCDRGALDSKAYMTEGEFQREIRAMGQTEQALLHRYHAVFHLVSAAKGAECFYTTDNNSARTETPTQAADLDDRALEAWKEHPYCYKIEPAPNFGEKLNRLTDAIQSFLQASERAMYK